MRSWTPVLSALALGVNVLLANPAHAANSNAPAAPSAQAATPAGGAVTPSHLQNTANSSAAFQTQAFDAQGQLDVGLYTMQRVTFDSQGSSVVGNLMLPKAQAPKGAVVVIGPVAFVKEQSPVQYATRLVQAGYAVLIFDPRFHGESAGEPRRFESGRAKVQDIQAAVRFLEQHSATAKLPLYGLGICQGVNWMAEAATQTPALRKIALVAGHYLVPEVAAMYLGSPENVQTRINAAKAAQAKWDQTGQVDYIPVVSESDPKALLTAPVIRQFYSRWADRGPFWNFHGLWENRITKASEALIWGHDVRPVMAALKTPTLMVHGSRAASGMKVPQDLFASIATPQKQWLNLGDKNQMQFYEDPITIDLTARHLGDFFTAQ